MVYDPTIHSFNKGAEIVSNKGITVEFAYRYYSYDQIIWKRMNTPLWNFIFSDTQQSLKDMFDAWCLECEDKAVVENVQIFHNYSDIENTTQVPESGSILGIIIFGLFLLKIGRKKRD